VLRRLARSPEARAAPAARAPLRAADRAGTLFLAAAVFVVGAVPFAAAVFVAGAAFFADALFFADAVALAGTVAFVDALAPEVEAISRSSLQPTRG
jgi:hypothetical protein